MSSQPDRQFLDPHEALKVRLQAIVHGVKPAARTDRVVYRVAGGPPGKRLETVIQISGTGELAASYLDEMAGIARRETTSKLPKSEVAILLGAVLDSGLLDEGESGERFLPDSLVASIAVETEGVSVAKHFSADERHGSALGKQLSPALQQLHPILDRFSKRALRTITSRDKRR